MPDPIPTAKAESLREQERLQELNASLEQQVELRSRQLRQSEQRFRQLAENIEEVFWLADANRPKMYYVSPAYERIFGRSCTSLYREPLSFLDAIHSEDRPRVEATLSAQRQTICELEFRIVRQDSDSALPPAEEGAMAAAGGVRWIRTRTFPVCDRRGRVARIAGISEDITRRKRVEQELSDREQRMRTIFQTAADAIITIDDRGLITSFNQAAERIFGYSAAEILEQNVNRLMTESDACEHDRYLARYLATGEAKVLGRGREVVARRKDGSTFPAELTVSEFEDRRKFTGILRDISHRKALEREIVEIATAEQRRIGQDLHDGMGQEMTGLRYLTQSLVEMLQSRGSEADPACRLAQRVAAVMAGVQQELRCVIRGLVPVEVDGEGLRAALQELALRTSATFDLCCDFECEAPVSVENNSAAIQLYRIAQEAVTNAVKHGPPQQITILLRQHPQAIVLEVADDGPGFDLQRDEQPGMGLKIMRYRAGLIGGQFDVERRQPQGTLARCVFPTRS